MRYILYDYSGLMTEDGYESVVTTTFDEEFDSKYELEEYLLKQIKVRGLYLFEDESFMKIGKAYGCFSIDIYADNGELIQGDDYYYEERYYKCDI